MTVVPRWNRCVSHRGAVAEEFVRDYFGKADRRVCVIGGAGFDPRSTRLAGLIGEVAGERVSGLFLREQRPWQTSDLIQEADKNAERLANLIRSSTIERFDIFDIDNAPIGGRRATSVVHGGVDWADVTDVVLDCSALSVSVFFPIARYCYERARTKQKPANCHLFVVDDPETDGAIEAVSCGKASPLHTFQGGLNLEANRDSARLWLPQLGPQRRETLRLIHQFVNPHAVCPILPFPSNNPRCGDSLIEEYGDLFEAISDPLEPTWQVDARDLIYVHEQIPLDLYRTILRIDEARRGVFEQTGGSQLILSPVGSKAVAIGMLMASLERDFAVVSVESIGYKPNATVFDDSHSSGDLVHIWLHGEAYTQSQNTEVKVA